METKNVSKAVISSISSEIVKHTAELRDKEFNGASIQAVEKKFLKAIGQAGAAGISELFSQNDEHRPIILEDNKRCYRKFKSVGKYLTLLGEISVLRGLYQNNYSQKSVCPLEKKLEFINDYVSYGATEYIAYNAALMTPKDLLKHCEKWSFMKPSQSTIKRVTDYVGSFLEESNFFDIIQTDDSVPSEAITLAISMDATSVLVKKEGWKHAVAGTVSTYDNDGNRLETIYFGRMPEEKKKTIKRLLVKEVESKLAQQNFKQIVCIADGARENWRYFKKKYPKAIYITDYFHVAEHLAKLSELLFKDSKEANAWFKKYRRILKDDPNGASKVIRAIRYRRSLVRKNDKIEQELKYLQHNRHRMNYFEYKQKKLPIGSGVIEAACKNLIGARLKKSGMSWSIEGGQNVLNLRALILSNRWEKFWDYFIKSHFPKYAT